jgi:hypothetical protein
LLYRIAAGVFTLCVIAGLRTDAAVAVLPSNSVQAKAAHIEPIRTAELVSSKVHAGSAIDVADAARAGVSAEVLELALQATACAVSSGDIEQPPTLTLIDYSRPSVEPRLWVFDLSTGELLFRELVAHGRNTGENYAEHFSNQMESRQSSIGLFVTDDTYVGSNGYSLRLDGLDTGFNDRARDRAIVMHGAPYVNEQIAATQGRIGRSWGCPALRTAIAAKVIDTIRGGGVVFSYYPNQEWLRTSRFLKGCGNS